MIKYYWESDRSNGTFLAENDIEAKKRKAKLQKTKNILIVYRESDTKDGLPFVEI